jgi:hypothetical protein
MKGEWMEMSIDPCMSRQSLPKLIVMRAKSVREREREGERARFSTGNMHILRSSNYPAYISASLGHPTILWATQVQLVDL